MQRQKRQFQPKNNRHKKTLRRKKTGMFEGLKVRQSMWTFGIKGGEQF